MAKLPSRKPDTPTPNPSRRRFYSADAATFCAESDEQILNTLLAQGAQGGNTVTSEQERAWEQQIAVLKTKLAKLPGAHVAFEYVIPRMGKRVDVIILYRGRVFVLEFKVGESRYPLAALNQALDYALDLKNFHEPSHDRDIVPVLVSTQAGQTNMTTRRYHDGVYKPIESNDVLLQDVWQLAEFHDDAPPTLDPSLWLNGRYRPTPTIIEAAQALYAGHRVDDISRHGAGAVNLTATEAVVTRLVNRAKAESFKAICFVTGVPGSGKTLAGLNIATKMSRAEDQEDALFLSGNGPLVQVLQESLARDSVAAAKERQERLRKGAALSEAKAFIQILHRWRDEFVENDYAPSNHVTIFDEAQRAWTKEQTARFMQTKKGIPDFSMSEPHFLIDVMNRHTDWAVVICLIGGGQEINTGEAGLPEWFSALKMHFPDWQVHVSNRLSDPVYTNGEPIYEGFTPGKLHEITELHLSVSMRSYRSSRLSDFVSALLDGEVSAARTLYQELGDEYPIFVTRDIDRAKAWLRKKARGTESKGITASSGGYRLRPFGIDVKRKIEPATWFLNDADDVRSSDFLEDVATEFDVQGLELDWTCVAWDANLRRKKDGWSYHAFRGTKWVNMRSEVDQRYLLNSYRVLLTRARQGMVIFVPLGSELDEESERLIDLTRDPNFYDSTFNYLVKIGIPTL